MKVIGSDRSIFPKPRQQLSQTGNFTNGIVSSTAMVITLQPLFTAKTFVFEKKRLPPLKWNVLYRGLKPNLGAIPPGQGIAFFVNGFIRKHLIKEPTPSKKQKVLTGIAAGIASAPVSTAMNRLMCLQQMRGDSIVFIERQIVKIDGYYGFMKGLTPMMMRTSFFFGAVFGLKDIIEKPFEKHIPNVHLRRMSSGFIAGAIAGAASTFPDRVRTNMQVDLKGSYSPWKTARRILTKEGLKGACVGMGTRAVLIGLDIAYLSEAREVFPQFFPDFLFQNRIDTRGSV